MKFKVYNFIKKKFVLRCFNPSLILRTISLRSILILLLSVYEVVPSRQFFKAKYFRLILYQCYIHSLILVNHINPEDKTTSLCLNAT
jgi:hypothetical protein